jgi:hypothetical protein
VEETLNRVITDIGGIPSGQGQAHHRHGRVFAARSCTRTSSSTAPWSCSGRARSSMSTTGRCS